MPATVDGLRASNPSTANIQTSKLACVLMNLRGVADPAHPERDVVDLLFFPTGGGKTEACLGLAAFTLALRRLRRPDDAGRGCRC